IEFDVQPSIDQFLMIFHDRKGIERTSTGAGRIPDLTYSYLRSLDVGSWFDKDFKGLKIPTLEETLNLLTSISESILFNIELKYYSDNSPWFEDKILKEIYKFDIQDRVVITARYVENIQRLQVLDSELDYVLLQKQRDKLTYLDQVIDLGLRTVQIRKTALDPEFFDLCKSNGIRIFYFYSDKPEEMIELIEFGVDGILTNFPNVLREVLLTKES
ncbi:MAG: glycerophosphodiester phosphodiesterase, partial [Candidatus Hodarchaeales archaeon]